MLRKGSGKQCTCTTLESMISVHVCSILTHAGRPLVTAQGERPERATVLLLTAGVVVGVAMVTAFVRGIIAGKDLIVLNSYSVLLIAHAITPCNLVHYMRLC